jgi:hypothetical protein
MFADPARVTPVNSLVYVQVLQMTFLPVSLLLMLAGVFTSFLQYWREALMFLLGWAVLTFFAINYEVHDFYVFFLPGYVFLAVWVGIGLGALMSFARRGVGRISILAKWSVPIANCVGLGFLFLIFLGVGGNLVQSWQEKTLPVVRGTGLEEYPYPMDNPSQPHDKARALINALEDNAIVFTNWDMLFPYYFVAHVESGRKQMDFHETYPQDGMTSLADSTLAYITSNMDRPIYFSERLHGTALKRLTIAPVNKNGIILYQVLGVRPE